MKPFPMKVEVRLTSYEPDPVIVPADIKAMFAGQSMLQFLPVIDHEPEVSVEGDGYTLTSTTIYEEPTLSIEDWIEMFISVKA